MTKTNLAQHGAVFMDDAMLILVFARNWKLEKPEKKIVFLKIYTTLFNLHYIVGGAEVGRVNLSLFFHLLNQPKTS